MSATPSAPTMSTIGAETDPLIGRTINERYKVVEPIGHGGMGRVYKALQSPLDRLVALKVLGAGHDRDPNFYKRFFLEASVTAKLTHPNTITLYDYGRTEDGIFFIAMEFLNGRTLSQAMQQDGPLAQERVIHVAQQVCRSLREAHALGIIHRDLKPANVMLLRQHDDHDFVKVLDFGLVKFFSGDNPEGEITNAGTFMGSPHYIAPEQARNQSPDQRCDIYSLGVLMYHMLTGKVPFTAPNPVDIILKHLHEAPVPTRQARPELHIDPRLDAIVLRCMAKEREGRFQSMDEMLVQLELVRHQLTGSAGPQSGPPVTPEGMRPLATPQPTMRTPSGPLPAVRPRTPSGGISRAQPPPPPLDITAEHSQARPRTLRFAAFRRQRSWLPYAPAAAAILVLAGVAIFLRQRNQRPAPALAVVSVAPIAVPAPALPVAQPAPPAPPPAYPVATAGVTTVTVTSSPTGAEVTDIDGRTLGSTPVDLPISTGKALQLVLKRDGYKPFALTRKSVAGDRISLSATLTKDSKAKEPQPTKRSVGYKDDPY